LGGRQLEAAQVRNVGSIRDDTAEAARSRAIASTIPQGNTAFHGINKATNGYYNCAYFEYTMSDKFKSLDAKEKAALESTLYRCRALVGRIGEELRKKKPEHFVDERSLADIHASLERAADVLSTVKGSQVRDRQYHR